MSDDADIRLECVKVAAQVSSPSMANRAEGIVGIAEILYSYIIGGCSSDKADSDTAKIPRKKRNADMFS
jgi:hypothetical protein